MNRSAPRKQKTRRSGRAKQHDKKLTKSTTNHADGSDQLPIPEIAERIMAAQSFAHDRGGSIYVYSRGLYLPEGERAIERAVVDVLSQHGTRNQWSSFKGRETVTYIALHCPALWDTPQSDTLNVRNGLLDLATRVLRPHSHKHLSTVQLPVDFDPEATYSAWDSFISDVFPTDSQHLGYEILALAMVPDRSQQRAVLLMGDGGNGKSTYLAGISSFLGSENTSALTLHQIEGERFARAELAGKLANVCADIPSDRLASTAMFKAITGGDHIMAEYKFKNAFKFRPFVKLIFSCNRPFTSNDDSQAFLQRWWVIPFEHVFRATPSEIPREELIARLSNPRELSGVLNKALDALPQVRRRGLDVTPSTVDAARRFHRTANPIIAWIDANTVADPRGFALKRELIDECNRDAVRDGRPKVTDKAFGEAMRRARPTVRSAQRRQHSEVKEIYAGLRMTDRTEVALKLVR